MLVDKSLQFYVFAVVTNNLVTLLVFSLHFKAIVNFFLLWGMFRVKSNCRTKSDIFYVLSL
jgi:hypothetical protein